MSVRTTTVGSWWPQEDVTEGLREYHAGNLGADASERLLRESAATAIAEQRELGLTEWTGGEYFTYEFIEHMQRCSPASRSRCRASRSCSTTTTWRSRTIDGDIDAPDGLGYADAYLRERDLHGGVPKATVVGPVEVAINVIGELDGLKGQMPQPRRRSSTPRCAASPTPAARTSSSTSPRSPR